MLLNYYITLLYYIALNYLFASVTGYNSVIISDCHVFIL